MSKKPRRAKPRNIVFWYILSIVTFGLGTLLWTYELNIDAKLLRGNEKWKPVLSFLAVSLGALLIVPPLVTHWRTWSRVREATGADDMGGGGLQFCFCFVPLVNIVYWGYLQSKLNRAIRSPGAAAAIPVMP
jgi:fatty acid desaturase